MKVLAGFFAWGSALVLASHALAAPGAPIKGVIIKGGRNPGSEAGKIIVTVNTGTPRSYVVDPATLNVTLLDERAAVLERAQGGNAPDLGASASLVSADGRARALAPNVNGATPLGDLPDGSYTLQIQLPPSAAKGIGSAGIKLEIPVSASHGQTSTGTIVARSAGAPLKGVGVSFRR